MLNNYDAQSVINTLLFMTYVTDLSCLVILYSYMEEYIFLHSPQGIVSLVGIRSHKLNFDL